MRFSALALLAGAAVLGACGGGDKPKDTTVVVVPPAATTQPAAATGGMAMMPATGKTYEVKMIGDDKGYRFDPANTTIKVGDAVKFIMVTGGPHNVAFDLDAVPADSKGQLNANMPNEMSDLSSPMLMNPNEGYTISFAGVKPGNYPFHCTPHLANNMKGAITVQ